MIMTKLWLEQSNKARKLDYIQTKNRIKNGIAEYDCIFDEFEHPTLSADGFVLSRKHRWFYNFDADCVSSAILRNAHAHATRCTDKEINLPSFDELYDIDRSGLFVKCELKPEWESVLDGYSKLIHKYKLEYVKNTDFELISAAQLDFNYCYGVGLHMILPCDYIESEESINSFIVEFLKTETHSFKSYGRYNKDWLVNHIEQQNPS